MASPTYATTSDHRFAAPPPKAPTRDVFRTADKGPLGHLSIGVSDLLRSTVFYDECLATLGLTRTYTDFPAEGSERHGQVGYGEPGEGDILGIKHWPEGSVVGGGGFHVAFNAPSRAAVREFYAAAMSHGGQDCGPPGLRASYGEHYYAAFVFDPDGWRIEAVYQEMPASGEEGHTESSVQ
ncbi:Glyoxalase/Bleomycin resistance protein/Dihydroxybiphenyl dioxygenase [Powellomyces hirtus]|nr:Glyoxalase/Bleomycin resistance protein/Dihydroxybiphenyl dioxygenase [Powellomyces hirtus]